jgi:hypothetical protein
VVGTDDDVVVEVVRTTDDDVVAEVVGHTDEQVEVMAATRGIAEAPVP